MLSDSAAQPLLQGINMLNGLVGVILDPELGGGVYEYGRITETVDEHGRAASSEELGTFKGNIQPAPGKERELLPEGDRVKVSILIFADCNLVAGDLNNNEEQNTKADRVYYHGSVYRVRLAEPWREQAGFTKALAVLEQA